MQVHGLHCISDHYGSLQLLTCCIIIIIVSFYYYFILYCNTFIIVFRLSYRLLFTIPPLLNASTCNLFTDIIVLHSVHMLQPSYSLRSDTSHYIFDSH